MEELTKDEVFEVLSSSRRRRILYHLQRREGTADLRTLARDIAIDETGETFDDDDVKRFYISLYQTHVPRLEEVGLVSYDRENQSVALTERVEVIDRMLNHDGTSERRWALYYAAIALFGGVLTVGQHLGVMPSVTGILVVGSVLALALYQYYEVSIAVKDHSFLEDLIND
jgi:hypothetical protein